MRGMQEDVILSYYGEMRRSLDAAASAGRLDEDAQAAPILGALELASQMDHARKVTEQQLRLLLRYSKELSLLPDATR